MGTSENLLGTSEKSLGTSAKISGHIGNILGTSGKFSGHIEKFSGHIGWWTHLGHIERKPHSTDMAHLVNPRVPGSHRSLLYLLCSPQTKPLFRPSVRRNQTSDSSSHSSCTRLQTLVSSHPYSTPLSPSDLPHDGTKPRTPHPIAPAHLFRPLVPSDSYSSP